MFMAAARTLADSTHESELAQGSLYPPLAGVRQVSLRIAVAVADIALRDGLANIDRPDDLEALVSSEMYDPRY